MSSEDPPGHPDDVQLLRRLRAVFLAAADGPASQDPARAETSVAIFLAQEAPAAPAPFALLRLDRRPISVDAGAGQAEVDITLTRADLTALVDGELHLPLAIARGDVGYRGPVRKLLRITPVLRSVAAREADAAATSTPETDGDSSCEES